MTITIRLKTGSAAFEDDKDAEIRRILLERLVNDWPFDRNTLVDYNGNTVGSVTVRGK